MAMPSNLPPLLDQLRRAKTFEEAALATLRAMLDAARSAIGAGPHARRARMLRAMVHLRPGDGYQRLVVLDAGATAGKVGSSSAPPPPPDDSYLPSATAWRWLAKHGCAVSIDVNLGRVQTHEKGATQVVQQHARHVGGFVGGFDSEESVQRLLSRDASHLHVVPLRAQVGAAEGMISVEIDCQSAIGDDTIFTDVSEELQLLADVAAPYLGNLPLRPATAVETDDLLPVVGASMAGLVDMLRVFAQQDETVLIGGPTGAGKSRLARWCHARSRRRGQPFEMLDLVTVPEELQMAELFGWRKGAFTGAVRDNVGSMARAEGGTLFIDEIDKLSLKAQAGLLHVLEERTYRPLGDGAGYLRADVRFVIGTNVDLYGSVRSGLFREDLYYRINVLPVKVPPLSERPDEIALWTRYMATRRHRDAVADGEVRISAAGEQLLRAQKWPGNLRQLDNIVRRAYALAMMDYGGSSRDVVLTEKHFARALGYEPGAGRRSLVEALLAAATAFVDEAERLGAAGPALDLDLSDTFRGFVLGAAVQRLGSRDAAFRLLGKGNLLQNRNHHKAFRRELEKLELLCRALGQGDESPFTSLLEGEET